MDLRTAKTELFPHERFAIEIQRLKIDTDDVLKMLSISRPSLLNWTIHGGCPQKSKRKVIESVIPTMSYSDWNMNHILDLNAMELLNVWSIRFKVNKKKLAVMLDLSERDIIHILNGKTFITLEIEDKILEVTKKIHM